MPLDEGLPLYFEFIENLNYSITEKLTPSSCAVYKIRNGDYKVIKMSNREDKTCPKKSKWSFDHILNEYRVLKKVKGVDGIAQMLEFYRQPCNGNDEIVAIVKQYLQGKRLTIRISETNNQKIIEEAVKAVHKAGFVNIDLWYGNILVEEASKKPYIIDLGLVKSKKEVSSEVFKEYKKKDLEDLEHLLTFKEELIWDC
ncbi:serine/threonine protein kinase [Candidatus Woesearchaeota archaeon]|nr:serine/threonine protein kinase [Candidatus Woesearchaeota archaeon]